MRHLPFPRTSLCFAAVTVLAVGSVRGQTLTHRYSFNDPTSNTTFSDSVGGSSYDGSVLGTAPLDGAQMQLDGAGGFADLPADIISNYTQASFKMWVTVGPDNP